MRNFMRWFLYASREIWGKALQCTDNFSPRGATESRNWGTEQIRRASDRVTWCSTVVERSFWTLQTFAMLCVALRIRLESPSTVIILSQLRTGCFNRMISRVQKKTLVFLLCLINYKIISNFLCASDAAKSFWNAPQKNCLYARQFELRKKINKNEFKNANFIQF